MAATKKGKAKLGRPPKAARDRKSSLVRVLVTETQREELLKAAAIADLDLSTWIRSVALDAARAALAAAPVTKR